MTKRYFGLPTRDGHDEGFTLPELLITIAILGVVMVGLSAAFIAVVKTNQGVHDRLGQSHDAQLVANYLVQDAQSANGAGVSTSALCGATGTVSLSLTWNAVDNSFTTSTRSVSYTLSGPAGGQTLTRWTCGGPGGTSHGTVSHYVVSIGAPQCLNSGAWSSTCNGGSTAVKLHVVEAQGAANVYSYDLSASFRNSSGSPTATVPTFASLPFIALGSGTCVTLNGSHDDIQIPTGSSAGANCSFSGQGNVTWPGGANAEVNTSASGGCGTLTNCSSSVPPIPDPYAAQLAASPPTQSTDRTSVTTCPANGHLLPGIYNSLSLGNCTLDTGTYVIHGSLSLTNTVTSGPGGVLLYFDGASPSLVVGNNDLKLAPTNSGTWARFSVVMKNAGSLNLNGNGFLGGPAGPTYAAGIFYGPTSTVTLGGNGAKRVEQLIVGGVTGNGGGAGGGFWAGCTAAGTPSYCS